MLSAQNIAVSALGPRNSSLFQDFQIEHHSNMAMSAPNTRSSPLFQNFTPENQHSEDKDFQSHDDFVDLLHGNSISSNRNSPDFGMLMTSKNSEISTPNSSNPSMFQDFQIDSQHGNIAMSTPNARSSPLFQNFQPDGQTSPIGSPYSPGKHHFKPVTKNRVVGFTDQEEVQANGFDIFGFGAPNHISSERTLSSSSNSSLLSDGSFSHILRSIHEQGDINPPPMPSAPIDVKNGPMDKFFQNRMNESVLGFSPRSKNAFSLPPSNGISSLMNPRIQLEDNFHVDSDLTSLMVGESSPPGQQTDFSNLLDCLNLNDESPPYGLQNQSEKDDENIWTPQAPVNPTIANYLRTIDNLPAILPTNHKQLISLLSDINDLQEGIHIIPDAFQKERVNASCNKVKQEILNELSLSPHSGMKDSRCGFNDISYERNNSRFPIDSFEGFDASSQSLTTWNGKLPLRNHKNALYSCKVFLGGLPWDITESNLFHAFKMFNPIKVEWPIKDGHLSQSKGYAYMVFESEKQLRMLLHHCSFSFLDGGCWYHKVSSKKMKSKDAQIIPWSQWDTNFNMSPNPKLESHKTVFVGALHGMINAHGLALIMEELFGGVIYAGIDTDRHRYPIGSGRVAFNNAKSYLKAITARFIDVKVTQKFIKTIQVDPYLEDATCSVCNLQQGPYFCRDFGCFRYFCKTCFQFQHSFENLRSHQYIMRNSAKPQSTPGSFIPSSLNHRSGTGPSPRNIQQQIHWQGPYYQGLNGRGSQYQGNNFHNFNYQNQMQQTPGGLMNNSSSPYMR